MSKDEIGLLDSLIGKINKGEHFEQNFDGFYMLPIGEKGVLNKIVFTNGKRNAYSINTVIEIALDNETDLSIERSIIYASERKGIYTETNGLVEVHYAKDFKFSDFQRKLTQNPQNSNGKQNGARSDSEAKLSLKDSQDRDLTESQIEYFKDSKVRDEQGRLQVVYHGTNNEFYIFDKSKIKIDNLGRGFYFVDKKQIADSYAQRRTAERSGQGRVAECYLLVKKPFNTSSINDEEIRDFLVYDYSQRGRVRYDYRKKYGIQEVEAEKYAEEMMNDEDIPILNGKKDYSVLFSTSEANFQSWLKERKYDGLIVAGSDKKTNLAGTAYIVFDSNQIKLTTNKNPTSNSDIRFSRKNNKSLNENIDDILKMDDSEALNSKSQDEYISIMKTTPKVILDNVESSKDIEIIARFDTMYLAIRKDGALEGHYHNLGEKVKKLPDYLSHPLCIVEMNNGRLALISQFDSNSKNGYISIELNTVKDINYKYKKYNLIVTLFEGKDNYLKNILSKNGVSIKYKKSDLLQVNRQLHEWLEIINNKSDSNRSIFDFEEKVNAKNENPINSKNSQKMYKNSHILLFTQIYIANFDIYVIIIL